MHILITGAAGMIGRKLTERLVRDGILGGRPVTSLTLHDVVPTTPPAAALPVTVVTGDLSDPDAAEGLVAHRPEVIFHLAGVVSGTAEANLELGYAVNLQGNIALWEAIRLAGHRPRVVYTSTAAVFGGVVPDPVPDDFAPTPMSSYGTQKLMAELMLSDYSRRGFFDGVGLRLPTICVRPGRPNGAASGFFSGIIREPLRGLPAVLPVPRDWVHSHASPRAAVGFLIHAATMDTAPLGARRNLILPGVAVSVGEQIAALERVAGPRAVALIREEPDEAVWAIVRTWPQRYEAKRARDLGFQADADFDAIIRVHVEDELGGVVPG